MHNVLVKIKQRIAHTQTTFDPLSDMRIKRRLDRSWFFEVSDNGHKRLSDAIFFVVLFRLEQVEFQAVESLSFPDIISRQDEFSCKPQRFLFMHIDKIQKISFNLNIGPTHGQVKVFLYQLWL